MSVETLVYTALKALVGNRVYRDVAPQTEVTLPRITFQQVGGRPINFLDPTKPSKKNARFQVNCWDDRRDDVMALARLVEDALRAYTPLQTVVLGAAVSVFEPEAAGPPARKALYGSIQDFSFWYDD